MFTGIVKLAQIDDYIAPSQNCIQPKIMKEAEKVEKATVSLNDCLACSGCITSAQSVLIQQMSVSKLIQQLSNPSREICILVAPQVVLSIANQYQAKPSQVFAQINTFFKSQFHVQAVYDILEGISLCHELIYQQFLSNKKKTVLCSQCPGWICYAQKTLTQQVVDLLSTIKSPQQVMSRLLKEQNSNCLVVSIMPCYDKKLEAIRFQIQKDIKQLDLTITTTQFLQFYKQKMQHDLIFNKQTPKILLIDRLFPQNHHLPYQFITDQASNGYISALYQKLKGQSVKRTQIKNSDFIEYQFLVQGKIIKMAKCYGFRNIQKIVQSIKKNKCEYVYVQVMACPGGCNSGGGQLKIQNIKPKQLIQTFQKLVTEHTSSLNTIQPLDVKIAYKIPEQRFRASYKVIQKSLTQSVMNW